MPNCLLFYPVVALALLAGSTAHAQPSGYMDNESLAQALTEIAADERATMTSIGSSLGGQPLHLLTVSGSPTPEQQPALLIVAGLDAQYLVSTETATRIAQLLIEGHPDLLERMTVYIVPRANPDGAARNMRQLTMGHEGNARLVDQDRDRMIDEDQPDDLNGDRVITMMRRLEPTLDDTPSYLADPDDPRLNIEPDKSKNQLAVFSLYPEGIDNDSDGQINEDGFGAVDLNRNFMHLWPEHDPHAGRYPLSEPEAQALADFVFAHDNIVAAITIGKHDNLINQPDSKAKDITGRAPKGIDAGDSDLYKSVGEWFKEAAGMSRAEKADAAGSFHAWLYAQRGLPSFAVNPWGLPDSTQDESKKTSEAKASPPSDEPQLTPSPVGDISQETLDELTEAYVAMTGEQPDASMISSITPEMVEQFAAQAGIEVRRVKAAEEPKVEQGDSKPDKKAKKNLSEDAQWLAYFEEAGIKGFVDWQPFDHPTLGKVEIGGFLPGSRINPPAAMLDDLAAKHTDFVLKVMESQPKISIEGPEIRDLGSGLYEVRIAIVNTGDVPTTTKFSRTTRSIKPVVIRLSTPVDQIISGQRVDRIWGIDAHGDRSSHHWILRSDDIESETIEIIDPRFGNHTIELGQ